MRTESRWFRVALTLLGVALGLVPFANVASAMPVRFGVLGGVEFSKFRGVSSPLADFRAIKGVCAGVSVRVPITPMLAVEPQVLVVTDGISLGESEKTDPSGNALGTFETLHVLDRIQVPVLLRVTPRTAPRLRPFAFGGPYAATRLREYDRLTGAVTSTTTRKVLESSDFGIVVGGGAETKLGPGLMELQVRYDAGLRDLRTTASFLGNGSVRTGAIRVLLGYSF